MHFVLLSLTITLTRAIYPVVMRLAQSYAYVHRGKSRRVLAVYMHCVFPT